MDTDPNWREAAYFLRMVRLRFLIDVPFQAVNVNLAEKNISRVRLNWRLSIVVSQWEWPCGSVYTFGIDGTNC